MHLSKPVLSSPSRLHGSYEALKYGTTLDGLSDLTGGIAENVPLKSESTGSRELLSSLLRMTTVVLVKVVKESNDSSSNKSMNEKNKVILDLDYLYAYFWLFILRRILDMHEMKQTLIFN